MENGIVGQGDTKDNAIGKLKEAIESFEDVCNNEADIYTAPISIKELHEFLTIENSLPFDGFKPFFLTNKHGYKKNGIKKALASDHHFVQTGY